MPLVQGYSADARKWNIRKLMHEGHPRNQAVAIAYRIAEKARATEDDELGELLSGDFWISPDDARQALLEVRKAASSLNQDMLNAKAANRMPEREMAAWSTWLQQFNQYADSVLDSVLGWRLIDSSGVLSRAELLSADLNAWRNRYVAFMGAQPLTKPVVNTTAGPGVGPGQIVKYAAIGIGVLFVASIYRDLTG